MSLDSQNYIISAVIIQKASFNGESSIHKLFRKSKQLGFTRVLAKVCFKVICKIERIVVKRSNKFKNVFNDYDLDDFKLPKIEVDPTISPSGLVYRYRENDLDKIKLLNLNPLILAGSGILRGDILDLCPNGIISFPHADNSVNRGGPPGFWEVFNKHKRTGFIVQRLKNELDGGDVLYKGFIPTSWFYTLNLVRLYEISNPFLHKVIDDITSESVSLTIEAKKPYAFPLFKNPTLIQIGY